MSLERGRRPRYRRAPPTYQVVQRLVHLFAMTEGEHAPVGHAIYAHRWEVGQREALNQLRIEREFRILAPTNDIISGHNHDWDE